MKARCSELNFYRYRLLVRIEGFRIERLMQKAFERGITIRSLRVLSDTCAEGWIAADDLKALRKLAKSIYHIKVIAKNKAGGGKAGCRNRDNPGGWHCYSSVVFYL